MAVVAIKTEPRCKLCVHPRRPEIDALLERRSRGDLDDAGNRINSDYVEKTLIEWGVRNPNKANFTIHFGKHCEVLADEQAVERERELTELNQDMLVALDESDGTIDGDLEAIRKVGMKRIRKLVVEGKDPGITNDHLLKAVAEQTKRSSNDAARSLLGQLAGGLVQAIAGAHSPRQIAGPVEIIDAQAEEVS